MVLLLAWSESQLRARVRVEPQIAVSNPVKAAFHPDDASRLLVIESGGGVGLWQIEGEDRYKRLLTLYTAASDAAFLGSGNEVITAGRDGRLRRWDSHGFLSWEVSSNKKSISALSVSNEFVVSGDVSGDVTLWSVETGEVVRVIRSAHQGAVLEALFTPDGLRIATGGCDGWIHVWNVETGASDFSWQAHGGAVRSLSFGRDGSRLLSGGQLEHGCMPQSEYLERSRQGEAFSTQGETKSWKQQDGGWQEDWVRPVHRPIAAFTPNGTQVALGDQVGTVLLLDPSGKQIGHPLQQGAGVRDLAFSSDSKFLVVTTEGGVDILAVSGGSWLDRSFSLGYAVRSVAFSPSEPRILVGGQEEILQWEVDLESRFVGRTELPPGENADLVAFNATGSLFLAGDFRSGVQVWDRDGDLMWKWSLPPSQGLTQAVFTGSRGHVLAHSSNASGNELYILQPGGRACARFTFQGSMGPLSAGVARFAVLNEAGALEIWRVDGCAFDLEARWEDFSRNLGATDLFWSSSSLVESKNWMALFDRDEQSLTVFDYEMKRVVAQSHVEGNLGLAGFRWIDASRLAVASVSDIRVFLVEEGDLQVVSSVEKLGLPVFGYSPVLDLFAITDRLQTRLWRPGMERRYALPVHRLPLSRRRWVHKKQGRLHELTRDERLRVWTLSSASDPDMEEFDINHVGSPWLLGPTNTNGELFAFQSPGSDSETARSPGPLQLLDIDGTRPPKTLSELPIGGLVDQIWVRQDGRVIVYREQKQASLRVYRVGHGAPVYLETRSSDKNDSWQVEFSSDGQAIAVGNWEERVSLWTLDGDELVAPFELYETGQEKREIPKVLRFSPDDQILATGTRGAFRLWSRDGTPLIASQRAHHGGISGIRFSGRGEIVSSGYEGTLRLWNSTGELLKTVGDLPIQYLDADSQRIWAQNSDGRFTVFDWKLEVRARGVVDSELGVLFYAPDGWSSGTGELARQAILVSEDGSELTAEQASRYVDSAVTLAAITGDRSSLGVLRNLLVRCWAWFRSWFESLSPWLKLGSVPVGVYLFVVLATALVWLVRPSATASLAMRSLRASGIPQSFRATAEIVSFVSALGSTQRALDAWLRRHEDELLERCFEGAAAVRERCQYVELDSADTVRNWARPDAAIAMATWITGPGGCGKSALAFHLGRTWQRSDRQRPGLQRFLLKAPPRLPVLVGQDWKDSVIEHVADRLTAGSRYPTAKMIQSLTHTGRILLIIDGLSERRVEAGPAQMIELLDRGICRSLIVTSRHAVPAGSGFEEVEVGPLSSETIDSFICKYLAEPEPAALQAARRALEPLMRNGALRQLFARLALAQLQELRDVPGSYGRLVEQYLEQIRPGGVQPLAVSDFRRASRLLAALCMSELAPRSVDETYARGAIDQQKPHLCDESGDSLPSTIVVEQLVSCGLLERFTEHARDHLRFSEDPLAEFLMAMKIADSSAKEQRRYLRKIEKGGQAAQGLREALAEVIPDA